MDLVLRLLLIFLPHLSALCFLSVWVPDLIELLFQLALAFFDNVLELRGAVIIKPIEVSQEGEQTRVEGERVAEKRWSTHFVPNIFVFVSFCIISILDMRYGDIFFFLTLSAAIEYIFNLSQVNEHPIVYVGQYIALS